MDNYTPNKRGGAKKVYLPYEIEEIKKTKSNLLFTILI